MAAGRFNRTDTRSFSPRPYGDYIARTTASHNASLARCLYRDLPLYGVLRVLYTAVRSTIIETRILRRYAFVTGVFNGGNPIKTRVRSNVGIENRLFVLVANA